MILFWLALITTLISIAATINILRWRPKSKKHFSMQPISILKPVRGMEPDLEANLRSFFELNRVVPFELLFCVKDPLDPAIFFIRKLMNQYPRVSARIFIGSPNLG